MSNIIDGIDFGMGYERATKWEPGLSYWDAEKKKWLQSKNGGDFGLTHGLVYRRKLPILANHPEAISLEPGEVLVEGENYLTGNSLCTGVLSYTEDEKKFYSKALNHSFHRTGRLYHDQKSSLDIIARLPNVAKEAEKAEKAKEEKVSNTIRIKASDDFRFCLGSGTITLGEKDISNLLAEVKRQEEAKRIGPGDWVIEKASRTVFCVDDVITDDDGNDFLIGFPDSDEDHCEFCATECRKIENPTLIAALNAEIDAKAGG